MSQIDVLNWDRLDKLEARLILLESEMRAAIAYFKELTERLDKMDKDITGAYNLAYSIGGENA